MHSALDPEALTDKTNAEITNGRLALLATIGIVFQSGLTNSDGGDWALLTASRLKDFDNELGIRNLVGSRNSANFRPLQNDRQSVTLHGVGTSFKPLPGLQPKSLAEGCCDRWQGGYSPEKAGRTSAAAEPECSFCGRPLQTATVCRCSICRRLAHPGCGNLCDDCGRWVCLKPDCVGPHYRTCALRRVPRQSSARADE